MKKIRLAIVIIATLVAVLVPTQFAFAAKTADVTVNVTAQKLSISLKDHDGSTAGGKFVMTVSNLDYALSKDAGVAAVISSSAPTVPSTGTGWKVKNDSATAIDLSIAAKDLDQWQIQAQPLTTVNNKYALWWGLLGGSFTNFADTDPVTFQSNLAATTASTEFWLLLQAPYDWDTDPAATDQSIVTFTAVKH